MARLTIPFIVSKKGSHAARGELCFRLSEPDANPFTCTDSDVEEAYPPTLELLDSDKEGESDIEID